MEATVGLADLVDATGEVEAWCGRPLVVAVQPQARRRGHTFPSGPVLRFDAAAVLAVMGTPGRSELVEAILLGEADGLLAGVYARAYEMGLVDDWHTDAEFTVPASEVALWCAAHPYRGAGD